jgi:hypothetical protein
MKTLSTLFVSMSMLYLLACIPAICLAQKEKCGIVYPIDVKKYNGTTSVIWYGWDFSNFKICDQSVYNYLIKDQYIPEWIARMNKMFSENEVRRDLDKQNFSSDLKTIQDLYKTKDFKTFLTFDKFELTIDSIKSIVKGYQLPQKSGAGFVIIIENLNKPERFVTGYLTFFDVATKEILWATKMKGEPGGKWGAELYYRNGILELYPYFFRKYYTKTLKKAINDQ